MEKTMINESLRINCEKCFGFCCVALYFSASEGFPTNKEAGKPCLNLKSDFTCKIHKNLRKKGLKGCTAYDCFGAGQKVAQVTYAGQDWQKAPAVAEEMFEVFLIMRQLHEMLWYLTQAANVQTEEKIKTKLNSLISEMNNITQSTPEVIIKLDVEAYRDKVNYLLKQTSEAVRSKVLKGQKSSLKHKKTIAGRADFFGANLKKISLRGADLRGAFLIAANLSENDLTGADLIGADLRDADLSGTNLENAIFVTQAQINTAKGNASTKLPKGITRPMHWDK
ncbi:pentapeptide repeat-containing protein [Clostridium sp. YIM B02555]|uniref:pentapeptide repeat-containing protein n=1 Tax=Clostridium sp. YIM B02555 TaxID=2911968 RepID=UPI001EEE03F6|nr:pentapeptide repeat-containing protein [Clostridium sp. YIM B02555]